uniref:probable helicase senataxin isoform X2 n=1 Tax=Myxine glutinosa TaxID=7769 RepID=UPI00358EC818
MCSCLFFFQQATLIQPRPRDFQRLIEANILEELSTIAQVLKSDEGRTLGTHHSAFLWFFPFIHSIMTTGTYAIGYLGEVIHHLVVRSAHSPLHLLVLSLVLILHQSHNFLHHFWCSSASWIPAIIDGACGLVTAPLDPCKSSDVSNLVIPYPKTQATEAARRCSLRLLVSLLRDGVIDRLSSDFQRLLNLLNLYGRRHSNCSAGTTLSEDMCSTLKLLPEDRRSLQTCISSIVFDYKSRADILFHDQEISVQSTPARGSLISTPNRDSLGLYGDEMFRTSFCSNSLPLDHLQNVQLTLGTNMNDKKLKEVGYLDNCLARDQDESQMDCKDGITRTGHIGKNICTFKREASLADYVDVDEYLERDGMKESSGALAIVSSDDDDNDVIFICHSNAGVPETEIDAGVSTTKASTLPLQPKPGSQCNDYVEGNMSKCKEAVEGNDDACSFIFEADKPAGTMGTKGVEKTEYRKVKQMDCEHAIISARSKTDEIGQWKILNDGNGDGNKEKQVDIWDLVNGITKVSHPQEFPVVSTVEEGDTLPPSLNLSEKQTSTVTPFISSALDRVGVNTLANCNYLCNSSCDSERIENETMLSPVPSARTTVYNPLSHDSFSASCTSPRASFPDKRLMTPNHDSSLASITCSKRKINFPSCKYSFGNAAKKPKILPQKLVEILTPLAQTTAEKFRTQSKPGASGSLSHKSPDRLKLCQHEAAMNRVETSKETASRQDNLQKSQNVKFAEAQLMTNTVGEPSGRCGQIASNLKAGVTALGKKTSVVLPQVSGSDVIRLQQDLVGKLLNNVDADSHMQELTPTKSKSMQAQTARMFCKSDLSRSALLLRDTSKFENAPQQLRSLSEDSRDARVSRSLLKPGVEHAMVMESLLEKSALSFPAHERIGVLPANPSYFLKEILGWDLSKLRSGNCEGEKTFNAEMMKLPLKYDGCHQYFNTMKRLLMIETWEKVVQSLAQKKSGCRYSKLKLKSYSSSSQNIFNGELEGMVDDRESDRPLHPVEGDLVLIWLASAEQDGSDSPSCIPSAQFNQHLAYVKKFFWQGTRNNDNTRFSLASFSVQTCVNISSVVMKTLSCELVCSLVSEIRLAKALLMCSQSSLFRILLSPKVEEFQPPSSGKELSPPISLLEQYNESQSRAIVSAVTMIIPQPRVPKVFLLQGPPGTGKSRTIVGLVRTLLTDVSGSSQGSAWRPRVSDNMDERFLRRVLICAPSHIALDDLVIKIIVTFKEHVQDVKNPKGNCGDINIVRLGSRRSISKKVAPFSLQSLIERRKAINVKHFQNLHGQLFLVKKEIESLHVHTSGKSLTEIEEQKHQQLQKRVISEANIICCSLNSSDSSQMKDIMQSGFGCIIVDEAAQSTEINSLVPLLHKCCKMVLVGDLEQLQPSVLSKRAQDLGYGRSLFERLLLCLQDNQDWCPISLNVQCRMHHAICSFPSAHFYNNMLLTDLALEHSKSQFSGPPYIVFDVKDSKEQCDEICSFQNPVEAQLAIITAEYLLQCGVLSVAVLTPYTAQCVCINRILRSSSRDRSCRIEVGKVEGFQGREKDAVVLSCVHANGEGSSTNIRPLDASQLNCTGFLHDKHQLNVALTRAKMSLIILGHLNTLMKFPLWNALITDARQRKVVVSTTEATIKRNIEMIFQERNPNGKSFGEGKHRDGQVKAVVCEKVPPLSVTQQEHASMSQNRTNKNGIKSVAGMAVLTRMTNEKSFNFEIPSVSRPYGDSFPINLPKRRDEGLTVTISNNS